MAGRIPPTDAKVVERLATFHPRHTGRTASPHGLRRLFIIGEEGYVLTPHGAKTMRRRRAARRVAHESRRRNRV